MSGKCVWKEELSGNGRILAVVFFYFVVDGWGVVLAYEVMMVQQGGY